MEQPVCKSVYSGERGRAGDARQREKQRDVLCSLLPSDGQAAANEREDDKRKKDIKRVVEQGEKALLVHGALPRKPLFVLHPFARARQATRENAGMKKGR